MGGATRICPECGATVGADRLKRHLKDVHGASAAAKSGIDERRERVREAKQAEKKEQLSKASARSFAFRAAIAVAVVLAMVIAAYGATTYLNSLAVGGGKTAPDFTVADSKGSTFRLSDHRGEVVVIFFMRGTWCLTCKASIPGLLEVYNSYKSRGVTMLTISTDTAENDAMVETYKQENGTPWTYAIDRVGVQAKFGAYNIESHFVIDRGGKVSYTSSGQVSGQLLGQQVEIVV
jgi:peroxiredoxin